MILGKYDKEIKAGQAAGPAPRGDTPPIREPIPLQGAGGGGREEAGEGIYNTPTCMGVYRWGGVVDILIFILITIIGAIIGWFCSFPR